MAENNVIVSFIDLGAEFQSLAAFLEKHSLAAEVLESSFHALVVDGLIDLVDVVAFMQRVSGNVDGFPNL